MASSKPLKRLGILVGGGPAPGINGVIAAVTFEAHDLGIESIGIDDGYAWLVQGYDVVKDHCRQLKPGDVSRIYNRGGSVFGHIATNPAKQIGVVVEALKKMGIDALVSIGGDDTATSASRVFSHADKQIRVAHVPKTIDNDLPLPGNTPTFGFETARHIGVGIVQNLMADAKTTSRWYLIVSMGRAAGHLALGIGTASAATLTIIPEEFVGGRVPLTHLLDILLGAIIKRKSDDRSFGVAVLAEGLIETVDKKELTDIIQTSGGRFGNFTVDQFGHPRLGEIEFGKLIREHLIKRMEPFPMLKTVFIDKDLGYEMRCADPIPFDVQYTRELGYGAVQYLHSEQARHAGAVIAFVQGRLQPQSLELDADKNHMPTRRVNVDAEGYQCARNYMRRLEAQDFTDEARLAKLAAAVSLTPQAFRERFEYVVKAPRP